MTSSVRFLAKSRPSWRQACVILAALLVTSAAHGQNLIENGSFESSPVERRRAGQDSHGARPRGYQSIDDWTIESGNVDYIGTLFQASDGDRSVDLSGQRCGRHLPGPRHRSGCRLSSGIRSWRGTLGGSPTAQVTERLGGESKQGVLNSTRPVKLTADMGWRFRTFLLYRDLHYRRRSRSSRSRTAAMGLRSTTCVRLLSLLTIRKRTRDGGRRAGR